MSETPLEPKFESGTLLETDARVDLHMSDLPRQEAFVSKLQSYEVKRDPLTHELIGQVTVAIIQLRQHAQRDYDLAG